MNIILVSQCNKNALRETRRILDQFANRIGERTWSTPITHLGLKTLRQLLKKTARRNTAVACHWQKNTGAELLWIVGRANRFDLNGNVPTNTTHQNVLRAEDENRWHTGEAIALLAGIAGLFHDFGKANTLFQNKLKNPQHKQSEPLRHEWLSMRLFQAFAAGRTDEEWLAELAELTPAHAHTHFKQQIKHYTEQEQLINAGPFAHLKPIAQSVAWLIVTHHRLPQYPENSSPDRPQPNLSKLPHNYSQFDASWNSPQFNNPNWQSTDKQQLWQFPYGLPWVSRTWCNKANQLAKRALQQQRLLQERSWLSDQFSIHLARLCVMLADHAYSAGNALPYWQDPHYQAKANTQKIDGKSKPKQHLDEHNIGVAHNAYLLAKSLPKLQRELPSIRRHKGFKQRSKNPHFHWQNNAYDLAKSVALRSQQQGFFGVNMASTGCGKTFANARIMYALADEQLGCRFNVALGLRTLTLQTGDALRQRLMLDDEDLAVLIGSIDVQQLHKLNQQSEAAKAGTDNGSESAQSPLDESYHIRYEGSLDDGPLRRWLQSAQNQKQRTKLQKMISAPIMVSTIDHLIGATEGTRGGKQIGPMLRLLSSDLVLDEPDELNIADQPALCRLVNWAGLLGSRVLLSSATLSPPFVVALFEAYQAGRQHFHRAHGETSTMPPICCAWFDEHTKTGATMAEIATRGDYKAAHTKFVQHRLQHLNKQTPLRYANLLTLESNQPPITAFADAISRGIQQLHQHHHQSQPNRDKTVSIGLVRMANIKPLVAVSQAIGTDTAIHFCIYHSQYPLLVRSEIEKQLDSLLARHQPELLWQHPAIQTALTRPEKHHIFIVFASPVAEVGRDHDYDWIIAEPSSMRSLIQLAGRLQRHRRQPAASQEKPNMLILNKNFSAYGNNKFPYSKPGYEAEHCVLNNHDLAHCLTPNQYQAINAAPIISPPNVPVSSHFDNLVALELCRITQQLFRNKKTEVTADLWWKHTLQPEDVADLTWAGELQRRTRFRASVPTETFILHQTEAEELPVFKRITETGEAVLEAQSFIRVAYQSAANNQPWFSYNIEELMAQLAEQTEQEIGDLSYRFSQVQLRQRQETQSQQQWHYHPIFGLYQPEKY